MAKDEVAMSLRFPPDLYAALKAQAEEEERSMAQVIRRAVRRYLEDEGER